MCRCYRVDMPSSFAAEAGVRQSLREVDETEGVTAVDLTDWLVLAVFPLGILVIGNIWSFLVGMRRKAHSYSPKSFPIAPGYVVGRVIARARSGYRRRESMRRGALSNSRLQRTASSLREDRGR